MRTRRLAPALIGSGTLLVLASWFWPSPAVGRGGWSEQDAQALNEAAAAMHAAEHEHNESAGGPKSDKAEDRSTSAQRRYQELRNRLTDAQSRGARTAIMMRYLGLAVAVAGVVAHLANSQPSGSPSC
jgi:hypothetical protein